MALDGPADPGGHPTMWQQFRRRRVVRTVVLYVGLMFLAIEAYLLAAQLVAFPPWGFRAVVGVAVLGFPLAVVLAWTYDVTPAGIVRTPDEAGPEPPPSAERKSLWLVVAAGAVVAGVILRLLRA